MCCASWCASRFQFTQPLAVRVRRQTESVWITWGPPATVGQPSTVWQAAVHQAVGIKGFSTGRHYWEVKVPAKGKWRLGVAAASVQRKGRFYIASGTGYWTICNRPENLHACTDPRTKLPNSAALQGLGFMWTMRMDKCPSIMLKAGSISILSQRLLEKCFSLFLLVSKGTLCYKSVHHKCLYLMENKSQQELT